MCIKATTLAPFDADLTLTAVNKADESIFLSAMWDLDDNIPQ